MEMSLSSAFLCQFSYCCYDFTEEAVSAGQPHPLAQPPSLFFPITLQNLHPMYEVAVKNKSNMIICCIKMFSASAYIDH